MSHGLNALVCVIQDLAAGSKQEYYKPSLDNLLNRCLHHHVFDQSNSRELLSRVAFDVLAMDFRFPWRGVEQKPLWLVKGVRHSRMV
jgi:hypothetical protein